MIRVYAETQPGVISIIGMEAEGFSFAGSAVVLGRQFYLAKATQRYVLYKPITLPRRDHDGLPATNRPEAGPLGTPS